MLVIKDQDAFMADKIIAVTYQKEECTFRVFTTANCCTYKSENAELAKAECRSFIVRWREVLEEQHAR